ncbi:hypothetical protein MMC27_000813 [Xylographa pallens]|nr:hypothetical protein [Xylographa pallens]
MGYAVLDNRLQQGLQDGIFERTSTALSAASTIPEVSSNPDHYPNLHNGKSEIESSRDNVRVPQAPLRTPMKAAPNSGRRRRGTPHLARAEATPSHRVKMVSIFKDAAEELRSCYVPVNQQPTVSPSVHSFSHSKRSYFPFPTKWTKHSPPGQAVFSPQMLDHLANTNPGPPPTGNVTLPNLRPEMGLSEALLPRDSPSRVGSNDTAGMEPLSSGFISPIRPYVHIRNPEILPVIAVYQDSDEDDCHSTHGVPYIIAPRVALRTPQQHKTNVDAWLDELVDPAIGACSLPPTRSSDVPAPPNTETGHDMSSPTPQIITKKMRGTSMPRTIRRLAQASTIAVQAPLYLNPVPRRPNYLDVPKSSHFRISSVRNSSNKENHAPPPVPLSWSSVASSPPQEHCVDKHHLQSAAAPTPRALSDKVDAISHPTFSTPSTLCSPDHRKKLREIKTSPSNTSEIDQCRITAEFVTHLSSEAGPPSAVLFLGEDLSDPGDGCSTEDSNEELGVLPLSPGVEKYRKGRGPRRERCISYWDRDIVPEFSSTREAVLLQQRQVL